MNFEQVVQAEILKIQDEGRKDGVEFGLTEGKREGLRVAVRDLCEAFGIELTGEQQAHIDALDLAGLEALRLSLKQLRAWPA